MPTLRTERLVLRPIAGCDEAALHRLWTDPEVRRYLWENRILSREKVVEIINESHLHAGHQPGFDGQGESHIRVRMVAEHFNGMSRVNIHRAINELCAPELEAGLHALAIDVKGTG